MLSNWPCFSCPHTNTNINNKNNCVPQARIPRTISAEARDLLRSLLAKNPHQRLGGGVRDALDVQEHAFYFGVNWDNVLNKKVGVWWSRLPPPGACYPTYI